MSTSNVVALYGDVNTVGEVEVPEFARPTVAAGRSIGRDQYGRPMIVPPGESAPVPYTRASSEAGYLTDGNALRVWQTRRLALALSRFPDLLMRVAVLDPDRFDLETKEGQAAAKAEKAELDELITRALDRDGTLGKADWGTAMHKLSEPDTPRENVPEAMRADLDAYDHALASRGIVRVESEVFLVNDQWRIAGTTDGVFTVPGWGRVVGDLKTGQLHPVQHAVQLAAYAGADRFAPDAPEGQQRSPLDVRQDVGLLIHVLKGSGRCELYLIDLEHGRRSIALAEQVRDARRSHGLARSFDDVVPFPETILDGTVLDELEAHHVGGENDPREQADPGYLEDAATEQQVAIGHAAPEQGPRPHDGFPDPNVVDPRVQPPANLVAELVAVARQDAAAILAEQQVQQSPYNNGGLLPLGPKGIDMPVEAGEFVVPVGLSLGPRLQREAEQRRLEDERAARARREAIRSSAAADPEAPLHAKVAAAADVRADIEATGAAAPAVERLRRERAERKAGQQQAPAGAQSNLGAVPEGTPTTADGRPLDVNGQPVDVRGDGFDDLRVSDPPPAVQDSSSARGLVTDVLGGRELNLAERIATASTRDEVNALWSEFAPLNQWTDEHHRLAQQRVALLG